MAKDKCTLTDAELVEKARDWISRLAKTRGREWCLRVPVDFNHDPDMIFSELCNRLECAKNTEQQVQADEIDNMPDACKKCGNRGYDVCPATNCQFHSLT
jgi:hypothetical protein